MHVLGDCSGSYIGSGKNVSFTISGERGDSGYEPIFCDIV